MGVGEVGQKAAPLHVRQQLQAALSLLVGVGSTLVNATPEGTTDLERGKAGPQGGLSGVHPGHALCLLPPFTVPHRQQGQGQGGVVRGGPLSLPDVLGSNVPKL